VGGSGCCSTHPTRIDVYAGGTICGEFIYSVECPNGLVQGHESNSAVVDGHVSSYGAISRQAKRVAERASNALMTELPVPILRKLGLCQWTMIFPPDTWFLTVEPGTSAYKRLSKTYHKPAKGALAPESSHRYQCSTDRLTIPHVLRLCSSFSSVFQNLASLTKEYPCRFIIIIGDAVEVPCNT
jgi:hypothetical protein